MKRSELIGATPMTDFDNQSGESDRKFKPGRSRQMKRLALFFTVSIAVFHLPKDQGLGPKPSQKLPIAAAFFTVLPVE
jgi:hypothetical protein